MPIMEVEYEVQHFLGYKQSPTSNTYTRTIPIVECDPESAANEADRGDTSFVFYEIITAVVNGVKCTSEPVHFSKIYLLNATLFSEEHLLGIKRSSLTDGGTCARIEGAICRMHDLGLEQSAMIPSYEDHGWSVLFEPFDPELHRVIPRIPDRVPA